jgi:hypothetical protein
MAEVSGFSEELVTESFGAPEMDRATAMMREGTSTTEIARTLGVARPTVRKWASRWGVYPPSQACDPEVVEWVTGKLADGQRPAEVHRLMLEVFDGIPNLPSRSYVIKINQRLMGVAA